MSEAFLATGVAKWNFDTAEYEPYDLPENCPLSLPVEELETVINCASCREKVIFGACYTSRAIHNRHGFGYPVCWICNDQEFEQYMKARNDEQI